MKQMTPEEIDAWCKANEWRYTAFMEARRKQFAEREQFNQDIEWLLGVTINGMQLTAEWYQTFFRVIKYTVENIPK